MSEKMKCKYKVSLNNECNTNESALRRMGEERSILIVIRRSKANWKLS